MKKVTGVVAVIGGILGAILLGSGIFTWLNKGAAAVSIIGGADGPTSVFLAGKVGRNFSGGLTIVGGALLVVCAIYMIIRKKQK